MTNSIYGMPSYYSSFASPVSSYRVNPLTNFMYGAYAGKMYSQTVAKKLQSSVSSYLTSLSSTVNDLKLYAKPLTDKGVSSSFDKKAVSSSDNSTVTGTASANADVRTYTLNVSKLATAQTNNGNKLNSTEKSFTTGTNSFSLKVGSSDARKLSFTIDENDTNKIALDKMSKTINSAKLGVTATVNTDTKTGTSFLKLTSDKTGTDNGFSIADTTGDAVSVSGIGTVEAQAQDAEYTLDGKKYTSQSNTISVNNDKVKLTLNKAEGKDIKISIGTDTEAVKSDIKDFISSYNSAVNLANNNSSNFSGAEKLKDELASVLNSRKLSMEAVGISTNSDGTLAIDDKKLSEALKNGSARVKDVFSGYNGIAGKAYDKSNEVMSSPLKYTMPNKASSNYDNNYSYMSSASRLYTQNMYSGLVVDTLL